MESIIQLSWKPSSHKISSTVLGASGDANRRPLSIRKLLAMVLLSIFMVAASSSSTRSGFSVADIRDDCDCNAPDGACSVSISCQSGCTRFCGNGGNCYAECSGYSASFRPPKMTTVRARETVFLLTPHLD